MAFEITLRVSDRFPTGTSVGLYPELARINDHAPTGQALSTATVTAAGALTFTNLDEGGRYVAYALVSGTHRYVNFGVSNQIPQPPDWGAFLTGQVPVWSAGNRRFEGADYGLSTNDKGVVEHGDDATVTRPEGFQSIEWIGTVAPDNATEDDTWVNPDETIASSIATHNALTAGVHGISDTSKLKAIVNHGSDATIVRPTGFASVEWIGTVSPTNALTGDTWVNPNDDTGGGRLLEGDAVDRTDPLAVDLGPGAFYLTDDENGGTLYYGTGATWVQAAPSRVQQPSWLPPNVIAATPLTQTWTSAALGVANRVFTSRIPATVVGTLDRMMIGIGSVVGGHLLGGIYQIAGDGSRELLWKMPSALDTTALSAGWYEVATGIALDLDDAHTYAFGVVADDTTTQMMRINMSVNGMATLPSGWWSVNGSSSVVHGFYTNATFDLPATIVDASVSASGSAWAMAGLLA